MRLPGNCCTGVTLIELLIVLAIIAVLTTIATPSFSDLKQAIASRSSRSALSASINQARNSAVMHGHHVVLCPSADLNTCERTLRWQHGWLLFVDENADDEHDPAEKIIATNQAQSPGVAVLGSSGRYRIRYQPDGTAGGSNITLTVCDRRGPAAARSLVISNTGRLRSGIPTASQAAAACDAIDT